MSAGEEIKVGIDSCDRVGEIKQSGDRRNLEGGSHRSTQSLSYRIAIAFPSADFYIRQSKFTFPRKCDLALDKRLSVKINNDARSRRRRRSFAFCNVVLPPCRVLAGRRKVFSQPPVKLIRIGRRIFHTLDDFPHVRTAPAATRPRTLTFCHLAGQTNSMNTNVIDHLAPTDVKTQAKFIIGFHRRIRIRLQGFKLKRVRAARHESCERRCPNHPVHLGGRASRMDTRANLRGVATSANRARN